MVRSIDQQGCGDFSTIGIGEVKDFFTVEPDGNFEAKQMFMNLRMFKACLQFYRQKRLESPFKMTEDKVLLITKEESNQYWESYQYQFDPAISGVDETLGETSPRSSGYGMADSKMMLTTTVFQRSLERKMEYYAYLQDNEDFRFWNQGLVLTATKHHTHYVLDESYDAETNKVIWEFEEMQKFMFMVFKYHLQTNRGQLLVRQFKSTRDGRLIYHKLKEHAISLQVLQLLEDT
jgi:hypothetical protein